MVALPEQWTPSFRGTRLPGDSLPTKPGSRGLGAAAATDAEPC